MLVRLSQPSDAVDQAVIVRKTRFLRVVFISTGSQRLSSYILTPLTSKENKGNAVTSYPDVFQQLYAVDLRHLIVAEDTVVLLFL